MHLLGIALAVALGATTGSVAPDKSQASLLPPIADVQQRAIEHSRIDLAEAVKWKKRARQAAYVPRLQVEYGYRMRNYVDVNVNDNVYVGSSGVVVGPEDGKYSNNQTADNSVGVRAIWELRDAVFNTDVLAASAEARNIARERNLILAEVNRRYYEILRLPGEVEFLREVIDQGKDPAKVRHEIFLKGVACRESEAALDALTGGWFSRELKGPICDTTLISEKGGAK